MSKPPRPVATPVPALPVTGIPVAAAPLVSAGFGKAAVGKAARQINPLDAIVQLADAYREYKTVQQVQATRRREIEADERVRLAEIAATRELVMGYLERSFDERRGNFAALFARMDAALAAGDVQALSVLCTTTVELARSSPFKDLATLADTRRALKDPGHTWEL
jgi:hypothetical protein